MIGLGLKFHWLAIVIGWIVAGVVAVLGVTIYMSILNAQTWSEDSEDSGFAVFIWLAYFVLLGLPAGCVSAFVGGIPLGLSRLFRSANVVKAVMVGVAYLALTAVVDITLVLLAYETTAPLPGDPNRSVMAIVIIQGIASLSVIGALMIDLARQHRASGDHDAPRFAGS